MSNFGVSELRVVNPYELAFREARSAVGASPILKSAKEFKTVAEAVADCSLVIGTTAAQNRELQHPMYPLPQAAPRIRNHLQSGPVALLFGSEKRGLSNEDFSYCHWLLHIPTREQHFSMNLGQAVAVCLYELARESRSQAAKQPEEKATADQLSLLDQALLDALRTAGYLKPRSGAASEEKLRRLTRRLSLNDEDATTLLGMLRQILWKLKSGE
jgi:TrmH family RNA methyltransferase